MCSQCRTALKIPAIRMMPFYAFPERVSYGLNVDSCNNRYICLLFDVLAAMLFRLAGEACLIWQSPCKIGVYNGDTEDMDS